MLRRFRGLTAASVITACILSSCSHKEESVTPVDILRLDRIIAEYPAMDSVSRQGVLDTYGQELTSLMQVLEIDSTANERAMEIWSTSLPVDRFSPMADTAFHDVKKLSAQISYLLDNASKQSLKLQQYKFVTVVWGRFESIVLNDSTVLIALNHYLGPDSPAYQDWPAYRRQNKRPDMIPYDLAEALIAIKYPYTPTEGNDNVLSRMLYEGVVTEAKMRLVKDAGLAEALGFTDEQLKSIQENRDFIWNRLISEKMLYSSDEALMDRLFKPLIYSTPISNSAPGRTVRFTGYEIIRHYLNHNPEVTLEQMLKPEFYSSPVTLQKSAYNPIN